MTDNRVLVRRSTVMTAAALIAIVVGTLVPGFHLEGRAHAQPVVDEAARAALLKQRDGRLERLTTAFNDIIMEKQRNELRMYFRVKDGDSLQSVANLRDPDVLPLALTRTITTAVAYPAEHKRILMIGLGGGSVSTYLARAMPELAIDAVDIDPGVIEMAKKYFAIRETPRVRLVAADGRAFLQDSPHRYDIIMHDAYHGDGVPSQLLTREFYELMRAKLAPGGAAVYNLHTGTPNYLPTLKTLTTVFPALHLYPSGEGEIIAIATTPELDRKTLDARAAELQRQHKFRYPLPDLLRKRVAMPPIARARVITDETIASPARTGKP